MQPAWLVVADSDGAMFLFPRLDSNYPPMSMTLSVGTYEGGNASLHANVATRGVCTFPGWRKRNALLGQHVLSACESGQGRFGRHPGAGFMQPRDACRLVEENCRILEEKGNTAGACLAWSGGATSRREACARSKRCRAVRGGTGPEYGDRGG